MHAAQVLAKFSAELKFADIPAAIVERAKDCIIDTVAAAAYGERFPWSANVADYVRRYGAGGPCSIIGLPDVRAHAPYAALANGVFGHAFEQDSVRDPSVGVHPGSALLPPILAMCEETGADGKTAVSGFVAGCEVMFRMGLATHNSPERLGFHGPGIIGPYGAAVAAGHVLRLNAEQLTHAIGIAGSLSSGLLAFSKSQQGGMVKRLHLGRAAESGVLAARLAGAGYTGPETVLDGKFGFLSTYGIEADCDPKELTADLHERWETSRVCIKRYACHINAHTPVQAVRELMAANAFAGADVDKITIEGAEKLVSHHNIPEPGDIMQAQYSVPFCVALALFRDPEDPRSFNAEAVADPAIRAACRRVELHASPHHANKSVRLVVRLRDGRELARDSKTFKGTPDLPLSRSELRSKFLQLNKDAGETAAARLFDRLENIDASPHFTLG